MLGGDKSTIVSFSGRQGRELVDKGVAATNSVQLTEAAKQANVQIKIDCKVTGEARKLKCIKLK
jgi:hypothetical protein